MSDNPKARLWDAVHAITEPTRAKIKRGSDADFLDELASDGGQGGFCRVEDYHAAVLAYGRVPALWSQANWAVFGSEAGDGSGGKTSARERTPADLDLMETLLTIRESLGWQLPGRGIRWRKPGNIPDMMRQLAGHIVSLEPQHVEWWAFRFEQWARILRTQLNALDSGPKPRYLRNTACPLCRTRQVTLEQDGDTRVVPALVVNFARDNLVRAAECQACGFVWWRGVELEDLAKIVRGESDPDGMMTA